jgi:hypothetical protein
VLPADGATPIYRSSSMWYSDSVMSVHNIGVTTFVINGKDKNKAIQLQVWTDP